MIETKEHLIDVQPLRTKKQIEDMKWALRRFCSERDYILFLIGINTGLRVSDILKLKVSQIQSLSRKNRKTFIVKEGKTKKERIINLNSIYDEVWEYSQSVESEWLFQSRKRDKPISAVQAWRILNKAGSFAEIDSIGTHTMRKTSGYWFYKQTRDVAMLQEILNHSSPSITLRYIGINDEEINDTLDDFRL